ncbi:hypothetical protein [Tessaracoccus caeni]|uniref:hypothetical protein n=1 Tax=Tessaracoccus caeni TaxID=3031239 RepID=UPI0023D9EA06|nr:hypothetical protein [Tessaracoccus caeni]MDF1489343.1 hypothetical protein [Tessaracoccus caeni]
MNTNETDGIAMGLRKAIEGLGTRGIRRVTSFPPELISALHVDGAAPFHILQEHVGRRLIAVAETLPPPLHTAFVIVGGFHQNAPSSVSERVRQAATELDVSARTVRRRFEEAAHQISLSLARRGNESVLADIDYSFIASRTGIDLRHDRPVVATQRTIGTRSDGIDHIDDQIGLPSYHGDTLYVRAAEGCEVASTTRVSPIHWVRRLRFPRPLKAGEDHTFVVSFELPSQDCLDPIAGFMPRTNSYDASLELRFGPRRPQVLEHFCTPPPAEQLTVLIPGSRLITDVEARHVFTFNQMQPGYCYGVKWHWGGPPAEELPCTQGKAWMNRRTPL